MQFFLRKKTSFSKQIIQNYRIVFTADCRNYTENPLVCRLFLSSACWEPSCKNSVFVFKALHNERRQLMFVLRRHLRLQPVFVLYRHHAKQRHNPRDKKNFVLAKDFKNIAPESGCVWSWCWFTCPTFLRCTPSNGVATKQSILCCDIDSGDRHGHSI